jgi:hypothetical protein
MLQEQTLEHQLSNQNHEVPVSSSSFSGPSAYPPPNHSSMTAQMAPSVPVAPSWQPAPMHVPPQPVYAAPTHQSYGGGASSSKSAPTKVMRTAGGKKWEDSSMMEWPKDDFRSFLLAFSFPSLPLSLYLSANQAPAYFVWSSSVACLTFSIPAQSPHLGNLCPFIATPSPTTPCLRRQPASHRFLW